MNRRAFTLSLVIAFISMFMVHSYMEGQKKIYIQKYGNSVTVIQANEDIKAFDIINDRNVVATSVPQAFKSPGSFSKVEEIQNTIALVPILKGEQITKPRVSHPDGTTGLARQVSKDKRAISIRVSDDQAVSKLIKPGDRVDIIFRIDFAGGRKDLSTIKTILQDVLVLSTGLTITNNLPLVGIAENERIKIRNLNKFTNYNSVTVEVDPYQAQKIIFQTDVMGAKPYLSLRNNSDKSQVLIKATKLYDILGEESNDARDFFRSQGGPASVPSTPAGGAANPGGRGGR
jgi:pilus assembly protein CpaB